MIARTVLVAALGVEAVFAAPNLAERWTTTSTSLDGTSGNSTNGTSTTNSTSTSTNSTGVNDTQILQFALSLEHIESAFYNLGLSQFNDSAFQAAGFASDIRGRFAQIAEHEATHVQLLESILGADAPQPCNYTFPFTDPVSYATLSFALESAGESAYLGASTLLQNKTALGIAGTILTVEARQAAWVSSRALNSTPWNGPFDTPLNASAIFSLASQFIVSCPSTNPPLPVVPLPAFSVSPANATVNQSITVSLTGQNDFAPSNIPITNASFVAPTTNGSAPFYVAYYHGFNVSYSEVSPSDNTTTIPDGLAGLVYASLVSTNESIPSPDTTLSGLTVLNIPVPAAANNSFN